MSAYKTNINELYSEFYHYNQSVAIAFDIEYIMLITYIIYAIKGLFTSAKQVHSLLLTMVVHSCKATFASGCASAYSFIACSVNILIRFTRLSCGKDKNKILICKIKFYYLESW